MTNIFVCKLRLCWCIWEVMQNKRWALTFMILSETLPNLLTVFSNCQNSHTASQTDKKPTVLSESITCEKGKMNTGRFILGTA